MSFARFLYAALPNSDIGAGPLDPRNRLALWLSRWFQTTLIGMLVLISVFEVVVIVRNNTALDQCQRLGNLSEGHDFMPERQAPGYF